MLKCLAAASRRNLSCEAESEATPCCDLLLAKFGTTEPDVIKEIFKKRIQDRVMRRGQGQRQDVDEEEAHDPAPPPVREPAAVVHDDDERRKGDLFGEKVNDDGGGGVVPHQLQSRPQNRDRVRQTFRPSGPSQTTTPQRQRLRPITTTTGWSNRTTLCLRKGLEGLRVPASWAPQAASAGTRNPFKPLLRHKVYTTENELHI